MATAAHGRAVVLELPYGQPTQSTGHTAEVVEGGVDVVDRLAPEWSALCAEGPSDTPFLQPAWFAAYLRAFEPDARVVVVTARANGVLRAVLPLTRSGRRLHGAPARILRGAANVHSSRFDVVHGRRDAAASAAAVWRGVRELEGWDVLELPFVAAGGGAGLLAAAARTDGNRVGSWGRLPIPWLPLPAADAPEGVLWFASRRHRKQIRSSRRRLAAHGPVRFLRHSSPSPSVVADFYALEQAGWKGARGGAIACSPVTRSFYDQLADGPLRDAVTIFELRCGSRRVAMDFGVTHEGVYYSLKTTYDEGFGRFSPGHLLTAEIAADCADRGVSTFDFSGELDGFGARWCPTSREMADLYVFRRGVRGAALHAWKFGFLAAVRPLRRRLRGAPPRRTETPRRAGLAPLPLTLVANAPVAQRRAS